MRMDNLFDIDEIIYCIFCVTDVMKTMVSLLILNKRCYKIYSQLTQKDVKNNIVRKYWQNNIHDTRTTYNFLLTVCHLRYVDANITLDSYLARLYNDSILEKKLIETVARFVFDENCYCLILDGNFGVGKSFLRELIIAVTGLRRCAVENINDIQYATLDLSHKHIVNTSMNCVTKDVLDHLNNTSANYKYVIEAELMHENFNTTTVAHITLTKSQTGRWAWDRQKIIMNELFSAIVRL